MHVLHVVGARPNFMKAAPVLSALARQNVQQTLVHTGQHYDTQMSKIFFSELAMPEPDINLGVGSASHAMQTAQILQGFEPVLLERKPDWVLVYGDVNSTVAAALVCAKLRIPVGHVEAGLRSFDRSMPEEINRLLTDQIADTLFTPSADADENLRREGISPERIHRVGNVMIDTLLRLLPRSLERWPGLCSAFDLKGRQYGLVTLHRPSTVDDRSTLTKIMNTLTEIGRCLTLLFPIHPRTRQLLEDSGPEDHRSGLRLMAPLGYIDFLALQKHASVVITDSGGIQEETTFLGVPCLTVRENTERPITVTIGTNILVGTDMGRLRSETSRILERDGKSGTIPPLWDGRAGERIAGALYT